MAHVVEVLRQLLNIPWSTHASLDGHQFQISACSIWSNYWFPKFDFVVLDQPWFTKFPFEKRWPSIPLYDELPRSTVEGWMKEKTMEKQAREDGEHGQNRYCSTRAGARTGPRLAKNSIGILHGTLCCAPYYRYCTVRVDRYARQHYALLYTLPCPAELIVIL